MCVSMHAGPLTGPPRGREGKSRQPRQICDARRTKAPCMCARPDTRPPRRSLLSGRMAGKNRLGPSKVSMQIVLTSYQQDGTQAALASGPDARRLLRDGEAVP